jgi:FkbM family methyltransferase
MDQRVTSVPLKNIVGYLGERAKLRLGVSNDAIVSKAIFGKDVLLNLKDLEQKYLAADCVREPENLFVYRALSRSKLADSFVDIGANCGHVAASIVHDYKHVILFEPNPKLASVLRTIFEGFENVSINECAIVGEESVGKILLTVPQESSGLATLGGTALSQKHEKSDTYEVSANTLEAATKDVSLANAYIKIDVEGFEYQVIDSARDLISRDRPIVGFEALSREAAERCSSLFKNCDFYCARFSFLEHGGALTRSALGIMKAVLIGGAIDFIKIDNFSESELNNFSQVYSVPKEKSAAFEVALAEYATMVSVWDIAGIETWSQFG